MGKLANLAYEGLNRYFHSVSTFGYKNYGEVYKLLTLLYIEEVIFGPLGLYINECDYRTITNVLYCLYGSTCLIPYPEFNVDSELVQALNLRVPKILESSILRYSQDEQLRLHSE